MITILDTANLKDIRKWSHIFGNCLVTTNPHLLKKEGVDSQEKFAKFVIDVEEIWGNIKEHPTIFFQCVTREDVEFIQELNHEVDSQLVAKITMLPEFYPVVRRAIKLNIPTAATTCYDLVQIHQAGEWNMDYSMVYYAKNENETFLQDAVDMKRNYDFSTQLVAASFRTKKDFITAIKSGVDCATVPPAVLEDAYNNLFAEADVKKIRGN